MQTQALLAHRLRDMGHYAEAIELLEGALAEFRHAGVRAWIFSAAHRLALAYSHVGQHARAIKLLADDPEGLPLKVRAIWQAHRGEVARLSGGEGLTAVAAWAMARERFGMAMAAHARAASCALAQGAVDRSVAQVEAALRLACDYEPDNFYRAELWWVGSRALLAAGRGQESDKLLAQGRDWILGVAHKHVPAEFRDSFLNRNSINRALLTGTRRRLPTP
jgi:tetratricopeptide (TPR) repeat protein